MNAVAGPDLLRKAFRRFPTGIAVITASNGSGLPFGLTVNSLTSVSLDPPLLSWCLKTSAGCYPDFRETEYFGINILAVDQAWLSNRFATFPPDDRFTGVSYEMGAGDVPVIDGAAAHVICQNTLMQPTGDHHIVIGKVISGSVHDCESLIFYRGHYTSARRALPCHGPSFDFLNGQVSCDFG